MPEYRRIKKAGGTYFFTVVTHGRRPILTYPEVRQALREGISKVRQTMPFSIEAWVLLPDHLHAIWTLPEHDARYAAALGRDQELRNQKVQKFVGSWRECQYIKEATARKAAFGSGVFGNMSSAMNRIFNAIWITSIGTR